MERTGKTRRILGTILLSLMLLPWSGCGKKNPATESSGQSARPPVLPRKNYDTAKLFNGIALKASVQASLGTNTALSSAAIPESYRLNLDLHVEWPKAAISISDLEKATPNLSTLLPSLPLMLTGIDPSPDYETLLAHKQNSLKANLIALQKLPYKDSLFDCQTILDLINPNSSRRALLVQAIMNVNADGSDGDRNLSIEKLSQTFQPQTNYRWAKKSDRTNSCLQSVEDQLITFQQSLGEGTLTGEQKLHLENVIASSKATILELKRWSFLVGAADPFIVLPSFMVGKAPGQPSIGDYAVVVADGTLYPAILGDLGPNSKIGEASLRICREIDSQSGEDRRPASRPEIVYLVFPGSAEKPLKEPNYQHWSERCHSLWKEFGGSDQAEWHEWTSLEKPWPTPTPTPTPTQTPTPTPSSPPSTPSFSPQGERPDGTNPALSLTNPFTSNMAPNASIFPSPKENR